MTRAWAAVERGLAPLFAFFGFLANLAVVAMVLLMTAEAVGRSLFDSSLGGADEISGFLLVASTFFGLAVAVRRDALFRFEPIAAALPPRLAVWHERAICLLAILVSSLVCQKLWVYALRNFQRGAVSDGYYPVPLWIVQMTMPIGLAVLIIALLERLLRPTGSRT